MKERWSSDLKSALYEHLAGTGALPVVQNFILGIGGREIRTEDLTQTLRAATKEQGCERAQYG